MLEAELDSILYDARNHHQAGRFTDAQKLYEKFLTLKPNIAEVQSKLGAALAAQGKFKQSISILNKAIENAPNLTDAYINLGGVLHIQGDTEGAIDLFKRAIELDPNQISAHINLGNTFLRQEDLDGATNAYTLALRIDSNSHEALNGLASTKMKNNNFEEASNLFKRALANSQNQPETLCNYGILLRNQGKFEESEKTLRKALKIKPKSVEFHINLGNTLKSRRKLDDAMESYQQAISLDPNNADAHWNKAQILLMLGNLEEGWREYEWRTKCSEFQLLIWRPGGPTWDGSDLNKKTILIYCEQGFGDSIQFIRYAQLIKKLGARIIVKCQPKLKSLFETMPEIERTITRSDKTTAYHFQASILSLPYLIKTTPETIPSEVPYLFLPEKKYDGLIRNGKLNVGIVWSGSPSHKNDQHRSMSLKNFQPLFDAKNFNFYSLQFGERNQDIISFGFTDVLKSLEEDLDGFWATALVLKKLDLIISVDTSTAHLAGALGKPVWNLLSFVPDWRWMLDREDSPWYPSMRLFRQNTPGDWLSVIKNVKYALENEFPN